MRYFAMGDSNMIGANTVPDHRNYGPDPDNFFNIVANQFGFTFDCYAKNGASNNHIIRMTEQWIESTPGPKFVFVGWSTWEREEHQVDNVYYDIDAWTINNVVDYPSELQFHAQQLKQKIDADKNYMSSSSQKWAQRIQHFANSLDQRGIKYLFWNAYMSLQDPVLEFDHRYVLPYNDCFNQFWYLKRVRNHHPLVHDPYHFDSQGHGMWAEFLIQYIKDWKILNDI
jgi:hypothetical protein